MMNRYLAPLACLFAVLAAALLIGPGAAHAQERGSDLPRVSPNAVVGQTVGVTEVTIRYGRPGVRGRDIFGDLVPYDQVWRAGANEATAITFTDDVRVEGEPLAAGTYALFTIPGQEEWTIIFNENEEQWGAFSHDESQDVLRVTVTPRTADRSWELLTYVFENVTDTTAEAVLYWADVAVPIGFSVDTDAAVQARAEAAVPEAQDWQVPYQFAAYALESDLPAEEALRWADRAAELEENYNTLALRARLLAKAGRYDEAAQVGAQAVEMGQAMDEAPNGLAELEEEVTSWESQ